MLRAEADHPKYMRAAAATENARSSTTERLMRRTVSVYVVDHLLEFAVRQEEKERKGRVFVYSAIYTTHSLKAHRHGSRFICLPLLCKRLPNGAIPN